MRHNMFGANHNIVSGLDRLSCRVVDRIPLDDLLDDRLRDAGRAGSRREAAGAQEASSRPFCWDTHERKNQEGEGRGEGGGEDERLLRLTV